MYIKKKDLDRYLRLQKCNRTYITHIKEILRKKGVYEDHTIRIMKTEHHYQIKRI